MYRGSCPWEAQFVVVYESRTQGSGLEAPNVSRIVGLGGSICRILQGLEAPGGPTSHEAVTPGGSAKEGPHACGGKEDGRRLGALGGWLGGWLKF